MVLSLVVVVMVSQVEVADAGVAVEAPVAAEVPATPTQPQPAAPQPTPAAVAPVPPPSAATRLRNSLGVGFFGASQRVESSFQGGPGVTVSTPFLGVRWWTPVALGAHGRLGVELAGGVSVTTSETETAAGLQLETRASPTRRGLGVHAAVPFALGGGEHAIVSVAPEFRYLAYDVVDPNPTTLVNAGPRRTPGSSVIEAALRGGVEVFFGFIGVPNLSLELSARVLLRWTETRAVGFDNSLLVGRSVVITSSVSDDPFAVLVSSIAAKYYF